MSLHYHGCPITPRETLLKLAGCCFCVRYGEHRDVAVAHEIGQSVMLDNGAFPAWTKGTPTDWPGYYAWCEEWLEHHTTWAVIPDVIDGDAEANDAMIREWPQGFRGAPVWHMHEPIDRLLRLCDEWPRVCIGSSGAYRNVGDNLWTLRMNDAMNRLCGDGPAPVWLHMLRGMAFSGTHFPFASVDSTDVARNHSHPRNEAVRMVRRWDGLNNPGRWHYAEQLTIEEAA